MLVKVSNNHDDMYPNVFQHHSDEELGYPQYNISKGFPISFRRSIRDIPFWENSHSFTVVAQNKHWTLRGEHLFNNVLIEVVDAWLQ